MLPIMDEWLDDLGLNNLRFKPNNQSQANITPQEEDYILTLEKRASH